MLNLKVKIILLEEFVEINKLPSNLVSVGWVKQFWDLEILSKREMNSTWNSYSWT